MTFLTILSRKSNKQQERWKTIAPVLYLLHLLIYLRTVVQNHLDLVDRDDPDRMYDLADDLFTPLGDAMLRLIQCLFYGICTSPFCCIMMPECVFLEYYKKML